ncbi:type II toxin-antitoxin system antitoxin DNA ADP-ribosyl glycohydrolase DarG [Polaribacter sp. M15]
MIKFTKGNILNADVDALVNTVNTVGVMGKGIALAFKKAFPLNYKLYKEVCDKKEFSVGNMFTTNTGQLNPKFIINFPTKEHWRGRSKIEFIENGMKKLVETIKTNEIKSIAIPPLGCGNGGLQWNIVKPIILKELKNIDKNIEVIIYEPGFNNQTIIKKKEVSLTPARAMLLCALKDYQVLGYSINLLVTQKIAYFLQRVGEPLNLQYEKGHYGPYSNRLQHLLKYLNGYYLNFKPEETKPSSLVTINHFEKVVNYTQKKLDNNQLERLKKVKKLLEGFESPYGLELLATVDYISQNENIKNTDEIVDKIGQWTQRKKDIMKPFHIKVAHNRLKEYYSQKWL